MPEYVSTDFQTRHVDSSDCVFIEDGFINIDFVLTAKMIGIYLQITLIRSYMKGTRGFFGEKLRLRYWLIVTE
jgi:hypothetical protein